MGQYGDIYLVLGDKKYNFDDDLDIMCVKSCFRAIRDLKLENYVKQTYFEDSFLGKPRDAARNYIEELDKEKWIYYFNSNETEDCREGQILSAYCRIPGSRIFFNDEYSECLGTYGSDASKQWKEEGKAIEYEEKQ